MALKKPFGALNNAYYGPTMVLKTINHLSPKMYPKVRRRERPGPFTPAPGRVTRYTTFGVLGNGAEVEISIPARQSLRYWPRACHTWRSITRSEMLSRSTLAVTSPTGVIGWMTGPFSLKCSSHMSRRGSKNRIGRPARSTDAISEPLYRSKDTGIGKIANT